MSQPLKSKYRELRLILGDQLNEQHSWFTNTDPSVLYVLMEVRPESEYVTHHIQKIVGIFLAMRSFAETLRNQGHDVFYFRINDENNKHCFEENLSEVAKKFEAESISYMEPDEYRLDQLLEHAIGNLEATVQKFSAEHFLTERNHLAKFFAGKKRFLMESFYRDMRRRYEVLMDHDQPCGGQWNFDKENRNKLPANHTPPKPIEFQHDARDILEEITEARLPFIGEIDARAFPWPITRKEALQLMDYFLQELLPYFGKFQDALSNEHWSIYHSRLSFALNLKIVHPLEILRAVEERWQDNPDHISLAQAEGFIRQILGWREYMRGIYWAHMPSYEQMNFFDHKRKLPDFFWSGKTRMNCMSKAIGQSLEHAYAHHIQRLMITGNFSLLTGIDPDQIDEWYLGIYIDAFQWVEITNTRGMSQFADGGIVGTKPYVASASYVNKMGDHCKNCHYDHKKRTGQNACPFNSLYWRFLAVHEGKLASNQRMSMMYRVWHKMDGPTKQEILEQAESYLEQIEDL